MSIGTGRALRAALVAASLSTRPDPGQHALVHEWRLIDDKHWQIVSSAGDAPAGEVCEDTQGACGPDMVEVAGRMKIDGPGYADRVDELQQSACIEWTSHAFPERCARFQRDLWLQKSRGLETREMRFCIDKFEYPNHPGAYPWIMVTWTEAAGLCRDDGKRLCTEAEWTFACEGEEGMPYPYGYDRDASACVIDRSAREVDEAALLPRNSEHARMEIDRLWQGEPSGARPRCRSPFGVYDLTGNVDEWTSSVAPGERPSILKGGYWGPVRSRCRPSTRAHGEDFAYYQQGFRCCAAAPSQGPVASVGRPAL